MVAIVKVKEKPSVNAERPERRLDSLKFHDSSRFFTSYEKIPVDSKDGGLQGKQETRFHTTTTIKKFFREFAAIKNRPAVG